MNNLDHDVILASLKLARAMRRCPPERGESPFPPAVGRLLACAAENPGVSAFRSPAQQDIPIIQVEGNHNDE